MVDFTFHFVPVEEELPHDEQFKICVTKGNGDFISWRKGYYENGRWHLPYTAESVIAWADFPYLALEMISIDAWTQTHGRIEVK